MNAAAILLLAIVILLLGYIIYGRLISRIYKIDKQNTTPAIKHNDGVDFVPAKNWLVLFGHHFCSICGAGPIVGPIIAVAYWGWGPAVIWVIVGSIFLGAVTDFSSLILSMRHQGKSIATIAKDVISPRACLFFSWFILISLVLVIAVFAVLAAKTLTMEPQTVVPSIGLIPVALIVGWLMYHKQFATPWVTIVGIILIISLLLCGYLYPILLTHLGFLSAQSFWILILLAYCFIAALLPVNILLQPRDYLAAYILFFAILFGVFAIFVTHPQMQSSFYHHWYPKQTWLASGPLFPMLFITIACGAISGFHSLVSSGTTAKQIACETHACRIGYGSMIIEGMVGILVIISVAAGMKYGIYANLLKSDGPIAAFGHGYGNLSHFFLGSYGSIFIVLAVNTFILTTLDTGTRIAGYLVRELLPIKSRWLATLLVVVLASVIASTEHWNKIWPAFGTANQLIAAIALLVASTWLLSRKRFFLITLIPAGIMLVITVSALIWQIYHSVIHENWIITGVSVVLLAITFVILTEFLSNLFSSSAIYCRHK